jgi:hypothetical protein
MFSSQRKGFRLGKLKTWDFCNLVLGQHSSFYESFLFKIFTAYFEQIFSRFFLMEMGLKKNLKRGFKRRSMFGNLNALYSHVIVQKRAKEFLFSLFFYIPFFDRFVKFFLRWRKRVKKIVNSYKFEKKRKKRVGWSIKKRWFWEKGLQAQKKVFFFISKKTFRRLLRRLTIYFVRKKGKFFKNYKKLYKYLGRRIADRKIFLEKDQPSKIFTSYYGADGFGGTEIGFKQKIAGKNWSLREGAGVIRDKKFSFFFDLYEKKFYKRKRDKNYFLSLRYQKGNNSLVNFFNNTKRILKLEYKFLTKRSQTLAGRLILFRHGLYFRRLMRKQRLSLSSKVKGGIRRQLRITKSNEISLKDIKRIYSFFYHFFFKLPLTKMLERLCAYDFKRSGLISSTFGIRFKLERMSSLFKTTFIFIKIIKYRLMQYYFIGSILSRLVNRFRRRFYRRFQFNEFFKEGLYLRYAGRFTKKLRAWYTIERVGVVTFRNAMAPIDYSAFRLRTRFGTGNIVLALNYKTKLEFKNYSDFKFLALKRKVRNVM